MANPTPSRRSYRGLSTRSAEPAERIWSKIERKDGHWLWLASTDKVSGYGMVTVNKRGLKAHRYVYELLVGPIPDGLQIDHLCRVRNCVNPAHLEPVTALENTGRSPTHHGSKTSCPSGHEYDEANTIHYKGRRYCRQCKLRHWREWNARQQAA